MFESSLLTALYASFIMAEIPECGDVDSVLVRTQEKRCGRQGHLIRAMTRIIGFAIRRCPVRRKIQVDKAA
jgi:hypothetical protein